MRVLRQEPVKFTVLGVDMFVTASALGVCDWQMFNGNGIIFGYVGIVFAVLFAAAAGWFVALYNTVARGRA